MTSNELKSNKNIHLSENIQLLWGVRIRTDVIPFQVLGPEETSNYEEIERKLEQPEKKTEQDTPDPLNDTDSTTPSTSKPMKRKHKNNGIKQKRIKRSIETETEKVVKQNEKSLLENQKVEDSGEWNCSMCTLINSPTSASCDACGYLKPSDWICNNCQKLNTSQTKCVFCEANKSNSSCPQCTFLNQIDATSCEMCATPLT